MTRQDLISLSCELSSLCVFRGILNKAQMRALLAFLDCDDSVRKKLELFGSFVYTLADFDYCFSDFLLRAVNEDENRYIISAAEKREVSEIMRGNAAKELALFTKLTCVSAEELCESLAYDGYIPSFENRYIDFEKSYKDRLDHIERFGYGIFASAKMFTVSEQRIAAVEAPDEISAESFIGYDEERKLVFENTKALIEGRPAANVLLCGDAGTGKSSTVKACANHFYDQGVRLIEIRKDQLLSLSYIMGQIAKQPLKFIIFIDDLSFNKNDDCFSMLKAALEGSASAKAKNAVIYATSNRRHIIKEQFSDRGTSDDIHRNDTMQELISLSDRFGLVVYYSKPNKALYLEIVRKLAEKNGISMVQSELDIKAEAFALARGSRSPRAAEQFINGLL